MFGGLFSLGVGIQNFVSPVLDLFTIPGFAPLLATIMAISAVAFAVSVYLKHILPGEKLLLNVLGILSKVKSPTDFVREYNEIDTVFKNVSLLKHGWEEFCETLIRPDPQSPIQVFRNTIRPRFYMNVTEVEHSMRLKRLHFVSNLLVGIGLLLTFIGLVAALTQAGNAIGGGGADLEGPIKKLLSVAAFKFWTSVSGLGCSIGLRIFYEKQHNKIKGLLEQINAGVERGLQFVTPEYLAIEHLHEAREQSAAMKRFSTDLAVNLAQQIQVGFVSALSPVHESLKDIGDRITGGIGDAIKGAAGTEMEALSQNLGGIVASLNATRTEMDGMGTTFRTAMTEAAGALKAASGEASSEMSQQLRDVISTLAEESRKQATMFDESMKKLSSVVDQASEAAGGEINKAAMNLATGMNGVSDGVRDSAGAMAERMNHLSTVLQAIEERMNSHIKAMDSLTGRVQDTEKAMGATSRHLTDAALPVTQATDRMATTAEQLNLSIQGVRQVITDSHQNLTSLSAKMGETQQVLQTAWQSYDKRFAGVDENLAKALEGILSNVKDNIQSMGAFVRDVDQKLGQAVLAFSQNVSELNDTAENFEEATDKLLKSVAGGKV
jgi:hypothetical protein